MERDLRNNPAMSDLEKDHLLYRHGKPGPPCKTCSHPQRNEIEEDFARNVGWTAMTRKWGLSEPALKNHFGRGTRGRPCPSVIAGVSQAGLPRNTTALLPERNASADAAEAARANGAHLADVIEDEAWTLLDRARGFLERVEGDENASGRDQAAVLTAARGCLELLAKLRGRLAAVEINVSESPLFVTFITSLHGILCPECRERVRALWTQVSK